LAKTNYQYEKRKKELDKKRKKEQKAKLKQLKKNNQTPGDEKAENIKTPEETPESKQENPPVSQPEQQK